MNANGMISETEDACVAFTGDTLKRESEAIGHGPTVAEYLYALDAPADQRFMALGRRLAVAGDLFRHPEPRSGLIQIVTKPATRQLSVTSATELQATIADRLPVKVVSDGKPKGALIPSADLSAMLLAEAFLAQFPPLDRLVDNAMYLPQTWDLTRPGYHDAGPGQRIYYVGPDPWVASGVDTIRKFLDAMSFASVADQTNAVAAALTRLLRNFWAGRKPWFPIVANRSHAGKGTVAAFIAGGSHIEQVSYESTDWAFQSAIVAAFRSRPEMAVLCIDNARLDRRGEVIRSAFLERFLHEPQPVLFSPGSGKPFRLWAHYVVLATINCGRFSDDLLQRAVTIQLEAWGDIANRLSPIGDPKHEFLPANHERIDAELRGMVTAWVAAGKPLDETARHPFQEWARIIGGILMVAGFPDFLKNQIERRTEENPIRRGLAVLGASYPDAWAPTADWADRIARLGLTRAIIPVADQDTPDGRVRGAGVILSAHQNDPIIGETEDEQIRMVIEKGRRRWGEDQPQTRYRFKVLGRDPVPEDGSSSDS
jgi:hypothetical protein